MLEVSIIIVNYLKYNLTDRCIQSVIDTVKDINYEIIVVDNNSPNNSYEYLLNKYNENENIKIIKNSKNLGFGMANNIGVENAKGNYIMLLNPDVVVLEDAIFKMYIRLASDNNIGLIGCKLLNEDLSLQYSCRRFIKLTEFIVARTPLKKLFKKNYIDKINQKYLMKDLNHEVENTVDWVMGSCMLLRKSDFNKVEGFSPEYFMYFEDVDLCYKINKIGKKVLYYPEARMIHLHNQESTKRIRSFAD